MELGYPPIAAINTKSQVKVQFIPLSSMAERINKPSAYAGLILNGTIGSVVLLYFDARLTPLITWEGQGSESTVRRLFYHSIIQTISMET